MIDMKHDIVTNQNIEKPSFSQIAETLLNGEVKENMDDLIDFFKEFKVSPRWYATNAYAIKYKGKMILRFTLGNGIDNSKNNVDIFFTVASAADLETALKMLPNDMLEFFFKNMRFCVHCNPKHGNGGSCVLLGRKIDGICVLGEMRIQNPSKEQIEYIKKFASFRKQNILARQTGTF